MSKLLSILTLFAMLIFTQKTVACSCAATGPLLSSRPMTGNLVSAKVLRYLDELDNGVSQDPKPGSSIPLYMEIEITRVFFGDVNRETVIVQGDDGVSCQPYVTHFPIGSEWLLTYYERESESAILASCDRGIEVNAGEIEGYIRDTKCDNAKGCTDDNGTDLPEPHIERFSLDEFDFLQQGHNQGLSMAYEACELSYFACPYKRASYHLKDQVLRVPLIDVYDNRNRVAGQIGGVWKYNKSNGKGMFEMIGIQFLD